MSFKFLFPFLTAFLSTAVYAQSEIPVTYVDMTVPVAGLPHEGVAKNILTWEDRFGKHFVLTSETGIHQSKKFKHESDGSDAEIFAYHYISTAEGPKQIWKIYDYVKDCPVDIVASFTAPPVVTDIDNDGLAEIWVIYATACHGDVSPVNLKIILYEDTKKFAVRGQSRVDLGLGKTEGGDYTFDKAFSEGPKAFRVYAKTLWDKYVEQ
jgi:hypothetical protein